MTDTAQLVATLGALARRNEALEDFAALVAHELKAPLLDALAADDPAPRIADALDLVDALLHSARRDQLGATAPVVEVLGEVVRELSPVPARITSDIPATLTLPAAPLRVILHNLLRNAIAAGARSVRVTAENAGGSLRLVVDDDGVGPTSVEYAAGAGLGLSLSRRLARRFGAVLELAPRDGRGTRASLELAEAA